MPSKIKLYLLLEILCHVIGICDAYLKIWKRNSNENELYCAPLIAPAIHSRPILYFIADNNSNDFLGECLLRKRNARNSVTLLSFNDLHERSKDIEHQIGLYRRFVYPEHGLLIAELNENLFERHFYRFTNSPNNAIMYIIVTTKNISYSCDSDGVFEKKIFTYIEDYLNRFWSQYKMFHVAAEFPFVCPGYYVILQNKKPSAVRLTDRSIISLPAVNPPKVFQMLLKSRKDLTVDYPIRVNIFGRFPTTIKDCCKIFNYLTIKNMFLSNGYCGMDALIMNDILDYFQFNVTFPKVNNSDEYGYRDKDTGRATGSLGHILGNVFDVSFTSRFMVRYLDTDNIQFIHYVSSDAVCAVMRVPSTVPLWHYSFNLFKPYIWIILVLIFTVMGLIAKLIRRIRKKAMDRDTAPFAVTSYVVVSFLGCFFTKKVPITIIGATCLLMSVIIVAMYQSNINYMYTTLLKFSKINTLTELHESGTQIFTSVSMLDMLGRKNESPFVLDVLEKDTLLSRGDVAMIQRKADMMLSIALNYTDAEGDSMLYIVPECYANLFLSYIARSDFPFIPEMKVYIMQLLEAGLPDLYYRFTQNSLRLGGPSSSKLSRKTEPRPYLPSTLEEHRVAFGLLFVGYGVSIIALILEKWWAQRSKRQ